MPRTKHTNFSAKDSQIIFHTTKSLLYNEGTPLSNESFETVFDVTGSFNGADAYK